VGGGAYVIAQVFVAELVKSMRRQGTAVDEPHGPLGGTLHCVVLVEAAPSSGEVLYLDPFFGPEGQPLRLLRTELASALQSDADRGGVARRVLGPESARSAVAARIPGA
jgi:hypothetical protein